MAPERFRFSEDVLRVAVSRTRRRLLATLVATGALVVAAYLAALRGRGAGPGTLAFSLGLLALLAVASFRRRMGRLHERWRSFEIALDEDGLRRDVAGFPPVAIPRAAVASVEEEAAGIVVRDRAGNGILVPRDVEGYARARAALLAWRVTATPGSTRA